MGTYGFNLYIFFNLCEPVGLLRFMSKLCHMTLCRFIHIRLCSLKMGCYGYKLYILFYLCVPYLLDMWKLFVMLGSQVISVYSYVCVNKYTSVTNINTVSLQ